MSEEQKKCPFCMELIAAEAKKCRFCGEILDPALREVEMLKQQHMNASSPVVVNNNNNNNNNSCNAAPAVGAALVPGHPKSRLAYVLLGLFLGGLGVHNFYAGRTGAGVAQLLLTLLLGWLVLPIVVVGFWVLIEIIAVTKDGRGVPFA